MRVVTADGETIDIGTTEDAPTIGIVDYSRRETDDFGVTTVVERGFARLLSVRVLVPTDNVDALQRRLAALRAKPATWIADDRYAGLTVEGFYKDFSLDLAIPPVSYCTLTIEGLTETEAPADSGIDPAPDARSSTLRLLQPVAIAGPQLVASNVAENDYPAWSAAATYALGARVIKAATHRIYESAAANNIGNDPEGASGLWLDIGPTNRWAMFDQALGSLTEATGSIVVTLNAGVAVNAIALLDVTAATVRVQAPGYDRTKVPAAAPGMVSFLDMPTVAGTVTVTIGGAAVSVGTMLIGKLVGLGLTEASPTAAITDYSRKETDAFGETTVVERAWAKRMSVQALFSTVALDTVAARIASVRARPSLWIGDEGLESISVYGFFKDYSIEVGEHVSTLSLSVEGLSAAAKLAPLTNVEVSWPDIKDDDPTRPKPEDGATVGAPPGTPVGNSTANDVVDALKAIALTSDPGEVVAGARSLADAIKELTQSVDAGELVANAKALVARMRSSDMAALEQLVLNQERAERFNNLTHMDGKTLGSRVHEEIVERISGDEALASKIETVEAFVITSDADLTAGIIEETTARATADLAETAQRVLAISQVQTGISEAQASIGQEAITRAAADYSETVQRELAVSTLTTVVDGNHIDTIAAIASEATTRATADAAETAIRTAQTSALEVGLTQSNAAITAESITRASADLAETETRTAQVSTLTDGLADASAAITGEASTRAAADFAETSQREIAVSELQTAVAGGLTTATAAIASEANTRATADLAETVTREGQISTLTTNLNGEISSREAAIVAEATTRATNDLAETNSRVAAISTVEDGLTALNAALLIEQTTRATSDLAEVMARTAAVASLQGGVIDVTAMVATETIARVSADNALASLVSGVETTLSGHTASITELMESVDGVLLRYGLNLNSNGHIVGFLANNDGVSGGFDFVADYFRIWNASGTAGRAVFDYGDDVIRMQDVEVDTIRAGSGNSAQFGGKTLSNDVNGLGFGTGITVISKTVELLAPGAIQATAALAVAYSAGAKDGSYALFIGGVNVFATAGFTTEISVVLAAYRVLPAGIYTVDVVFQGDTTMKVAGRNLSTMIVYAGKVRFDMPGTALAPDMGFTRPSAATAYNSSGALVSVASDVPRFNYHPTTHALLGLLIEPSVTNEVVNSGTGGAVLGVIGSGGALPTGWTLPEGGAGLTREVVGISTVDGVDVVDIRFYGTASATTTLTLRPDNAGAAASIGQTWTNSVFLALIAGSLANVANIQMRAGSEGGGTVLSGLTPTLTRYTNTRTLAAASARQVIRYNWSAAGAAVDFTLRIGLPQRELGAVAHMPVKTSGAVATKPADGVPLNWEGRNIPDSAIMVRYTFDDGTYQDVATVVAGGVSPVPTNLNRAHLKRIDLL